MVITENAVEYEEFGSIAIEPMWELLASTKFSLKYMSGHLEHVEEFGHSLRCGELSEDSVNLLLHVTRVGPWLPVLESDCKQPSTTRASELSHPRTLLVEGLLCNVLRRGVAEADVNHSRVPRIILRGGRRLSYLNEQITDGPSLEGWKEGEVVSDGESWVPRSGGGG